MTYYAIFDTQSYDWHETITIFPTKAEAKAVLRTRPGWDGKVLEQGKSFDEGKDFRVRHDLVIEKGAWTPDPERGGGVLRYFGNSTEMFYNLREWETASIHDLDPGDTVTIHGDVPRISEGGVAARMDYDRHWWIQGIATVRSNANLHIGLSPITWGVYVDGRSRPLIDDVLMEDIRSLPVDIPDECVEAVRGFRRVPTICDTPLVNALREVAAMPFTKRRAALIAIKERIQ